MSRNFLSTCLKKSLGKLVIFFGKRMFNYKIVGSYQHEIIASKYDDGNTIKIIYETSFCIYIYGFIFHTFQMLQ